MRLGLVFGFTPGDAAAAEAASAIASKPPATTRSTAACKAEDEESLARIINYLNESAID
jgi:hypothetical protein